MPQAGATHDITLESYDGLNRRGYMLMRDQQGRHQFVRRDAQTIQPRTLTMGEMTHAELPPELELTWFQEDWVLGVGGRVDRLHKRQLAIANKIDATVDGRLRLARKVNATTVDSNPNVYAPTGFAVAPSRSELDPDIWAFIGRDVYSWDTSNNDWDIGTEPQAIDLFYKNGVEFGVNVVAPAWYGGSDLNEVPLKYIYKEPTSATWTVSTEAEGAFKYMTKGRNSSGNEILWGGFGVADTGINVDGAHNNSTTTLALNANPSGTIAVNDIILVSGPGYRETMLVTAISSSNATVIRGYGCTAAAHSDTDDVFLYQPHVVRSSSDPTNSGSWSSAVAIGEDDHPITGVVFDGDTDTLLVTKTDGVYSYTTDGQVRNITPLFRQFGNDQNFIGAYSWNNHILLPLGTGGLLDLNYAELTLKNLSFSIVAPDQTALHGVIVAMHGDPVNLFALMRHASNNTFYLLQAKEVVHEGTTAFRWNILSTLGAGAAVSNNETSLMVDNSRDSRRRVWVGFFETDVSELPRFVPFGNIDDDSQDGFTNDTDVELTTVVWDANLPRVYKRFEEIQVQSENLGAGGRAVAIDYQIDHDGNWFELDTIHESPLHTLKFPGGTVGKLLELRIKPVMSSVGTTPPDVLSFRVKAQLRPDPAKIYEVTTHIAEQMTLLNGARGGRPKDDLAQLRTWNEAPEELILYTTDNRRVSKEVIMLPGTLREQEIYSRRGFKRELAVTFQLAEV